MVNEFFSLFGQSDSLDVLALSREYPLSVFGFYKRVLARGNRPISYQALHKQVRVLALEAYEKNLELLEFPA